ncbi:MAG TPA: hypothetical protein DCY13_04865 [Verrucomicrobiales bacterium]|nr:hypothetical protein [Verrucomicrobiales bacterium]
MEEAVKMSMDLREMCGAMSHRLEPICHTEPPRLNSDKPTANREPSTEVGGRLLEIIKAVKEARDLIRSINDRLEL